MKKTFATIFSIAMLAFTLNASELAEGFASDIAENSEEAAAAKPIEGVFRIACKAPKGSAAEAAAAIPVTFTLTPLAGRGECVGDSFSATAVFSFPAPACTPNLPTLNVCTQVLITTVKCNKHDKRIVSFSVPLANVLGLGPNTQVLLVEDSNNPGLFTGSAISYTIFPGGSGAPCSVAGVPCVCCVELEVQI